MNMPRAVTNVSIGKPGNYRKSPLSVLIISAVTWPIRGGLSTVVHNLAESGRKNGDFVKILRGVGSVSEEGEDTNCLRFCYPYAEAQLTPIMRLRHWLLTQRANLKFQRLIRQFKIDILHLHFPVPRFRFFINKGVPYTITFHGSDVLQLKDKSISKEIDMITANADRIFVVSEFLRDDLLGIKPELADKVCCIRNGRPDILKGPRIGHIQIGRNKNFNILFVGDLLPVKGVDLLVKVFARLKTEIDCKLTMLGDGKEYNRLRAFFSQKGLDGDVVFRGEIAPKEVRLEMARADVLLLPSRREGGLPNVLLEAMVEGCPIVASSAGGILELIDDGINGIIFRSEDEDDLYLKLKKVLISPDLRRELALSALKSISSYPDWNAVYSEYRTHYLDILARRN